jgi:hypothetical protein
MWVYTSLLSFQESFKLKCENIYFGWRPLKNGGTLLFEAGRLVRAYSTVHHWRLTPKGSFS